MSGTDDGLFSDISSSSATQSDRRDIGDFYTLEDGVEDSLSESNEIENEKTDMAETYKSEEELLPDVGEQQSESDDEENEESICPVMGEEDDDYYEDEPSWIYYDLTNITTKGTRGYTSNILKNAELILSTSYDLSADREVIKLNGNRVVKDSKGREYEISITQSSIKCRNQRKVPNGERYNFSISDPSIDFCVEDIDYDGRWFGIEDSDSEWISDSTEAVYVITGVTTDGTEGDPSKILQNAALVIDQEYHYNEKINDRYDKTIKLNGQTTVKDSTGNTYHLHFYKDDENISIIEKDGTRHPVEYTGTITVTDPIYIAVSCENPSIKVNSSESFQIKDGVISGKCGDNLTWKYYAENKTLRISGTGPMYDFKFAEDFLGEQSDKSFSPWHDLEFTGVDNVIVEDGVTSIGDAAFHGYIKNITIADSVTRIGDRAFYTYEVTELKLPSNLETIGEGAFWSLFNLKSLYIPGKVASIGGSAFPYTGNIQSITVDSSNPFFRSIDGILFNKNQTKLIAYPVGKEGSVYEIPSTVNEIEAWAFFNAKIRKYYIPASVTKMNEMSISYGVGSLEGGDIIEIYFRGNIPDGEGAIDGEMLATLYSPVGNTTYTDTAKKKLVTIFEIIQEGIKYTGAEWKIWIDPTAPPVKAPITGLKEMSIGKVRM